MPTDDILLEAEDKMQKKEHFVQSEFAGVRTGKASAGLVENIMVDVYGSQMRIRELAGITTPEPRMILIQPWDASSVHPIEKAIQKSNLGLNPAVDKKFIRMCFERKLYFRDPGYRIVPIHHGITAAHDEAVIDETLSRLDDLFRSF